jgi:hypothetical protein
MDDDDSGAGDAVGVADGAVDDAVNLLPHFEQNFALGRLEAPQDGQPIGAGAPHSSQNRLPSGISAVQLKHSMPHLNRQRRSAYHGTPGAALIRNGRLRGLRAKTRRARAARPTS